MRLESGDENPWVRTGLSEEEHDYAVSKRMAAYPFLAKHLDLSHVEVQDYDGNIDVSFSVVEKRSGMLVFGSNNPYLADAVSPNTPLPPDWRIFQMDQWRWERPRVQRLVEPAPLQRGDCWVRSLV